MDVVLGPRPRSDVPERRRRRFEDVTGPTGTGHLQKGHGVSFADWDCDGDLDFFVELGGGFPGDRGIQRSVPEPGSRPALAEGQADRHQDQPVGHRGQNIGSRSLAPGGGSRSRSIAPSETTAASAATVWSRRSDCSTTRLSSSLSVSWPTSGTTQNFANIAADQALEITEGASAYKLLRQPPLPAPKSKANQAGLSLR